MLHEFKVSVCFGRNFLVYLLLTLLGLLLAISKLFFLLSEHKGGSFLYYSCKAHIFWNFIAFNALFYVTFTGSDYTWYNNQAGLAQRWATLDRCLVNSS